MTYCGTVIEQGTESDVDYLLGMRNNPILNRNRIYSDEINKDRWQKEEVKFLKSVCELLIR